MMGKVKKAVSVLLAAALFAQAVPSYPASGMAEDRESSVNGPRVALNAMDCVYFGSYWQEDTNGDGKADKNDEKTPIKWRILERDGDEAFLLSESALDYMPYDADGSGSGWKGCSLRKWLNGDFYDDAFGAGEAEAIKETVLDNQSMAEGAGAGFDTADKVYLLSYNEIAAIDYGLADSDLESAYAKKADATEYAKERGAGAYGYGGDGALWWLRTPGYAEGDALISGIKFESCYDIASSSMASVNAVRPALRMDLSICACEGAGKIDIGINKSEWDAVYFGNYWQEDTNGDGIADKDDEKTPIKWRVLSVDGGDAFLISDRILDYRDGAFTDAWEAGGIKDWLDSEFLGEAFSAEEKDAIIRQDGGRGDAFLLSDVEAATLEYGFSGYADRESYTRVAEESPYASTKARAGAEGAWTLETVGKCVGKKGKIRDYAPEQEGYAIRPAIHIDLMRREPESAGYIWSSDSTGGELPRGREPGAITASAPNEWGISAPEVGVRNMDCIYFGEYWQEDTTGDGDVNERDAKLPIKWRIISVSDNEALAISDKCLAAKPYNDRDSKASWEGCSLRKWLNGEFYKEAFNAGEREALVKKSAGGAEDFVRLASIEDFRAHPSIFGSKNRRTYFDNVMAFSSAVFNAGYTGYAGELYNWWVMPDDENGVEALASFGGDVSTETVMSYANGVRPVISVNLSKAQARDAGNVTLGAEFSEWDCIYFGHYPQGKDDENKPIKWRVLSVSGNDAFIMSDDILDSRAYDENEASEMTWKDSGIRAWLNGEFCDKAFNGEEKDAIIKTRVLTKCRTAYYSDEYITEETSDDVYMLSEEEASNIRYGFSPYIDCPTDTRKAFICKDGYTAKYWQLRDTENSFPRALNSVIGEYGDRYKGAVTEEDGVRPVLHIDLSKDVWERADGAWASDYAYSDGLLDDPEISYTYADTVYFGRYYDSGYQEERPIRWRVLKRDGSDMFLMAEQSVAEKTYHDRYEKVTWEDCALRQWLNGEFYNDSFSEEEKRAIKYTSVKNEDNPLYETDAGNDTVDKIYLPSVQELMNEDYGFSPNVYPDQKRVMGGYAGGYLTRTPGRSRYENASVMYGAVNDAFANVAELKDYVCPVMHIDASAVLPEDAGRIRTGHKESEWDAVYFGNYWQEDTNGDGRADRHDDKTPVKWRVLSVDGDDAYLFSEQGLEYREFERFGSWDDSDLRKWLNGDFYNEAFDGDEKNAIIPERTCGALDRVAIIPEYDLTNSDYGFSPFSNTASDTRVCKGSDYAKDCGVYVHDEGPFKGNSQFWIYRNWADEMLEWQSSIDGNIDYMMFYRDATLVRPVIHINLRSGAWEDAGKISISDADIGKDLPLPTVVPEYERPEDARENPWSENAYSCTVSDAMGYGFYKPPLGEKIPYDIPPEAQLDGYYRWLEICYDYSEGVAGLILYDAYGAEFDMGDDFLKEYGYGARKIIDLNSIRDFEGCLSRLEFYTTGQDESDSDKNIALSLDSIKLYSDKDYPPPKVTESPEPTSAPLTAPESVTTAAPAGSPSPAETEAPAASPAVSPEAAKSPGESYDAFAAAPFSMPYEDGGTGTGEAARDETETPAQTVRNGKKLLKRPSFSIKKKRSGKTRYIEIRLKSYEGGYIQVYVKNGGKPYKRASFDNVRIKDYKGVFKIRYTKRNQRLRVKARTYKLKGKKRIYSGFSEEKRIVT